MMDYADTLRSKKSRHVVAYRKFLSLYAKNKKDLFCFLEGFDDSLYYGPQIINLYKDVNYQFLNCLGKDGVLNISSLICHSSEYKDVKAFYFVDADFDNNRGVDSNIYVTPCYSIENLYISVNVFTKILRCEFQLTDADNDFYKMIDIYRARQKEFHDAVHLLNAWICCQKELGVRLDIDEILKPEVFYRIIRIKVDGIEKKYDLEYLYRKFPESKNIDSKVLTQKLSDFANFDNGKIFRGKFELLFLKKILEHISSDANRKQPEFFENRVKNSICLSGNLLSLFANYADVPEGLITYLSKFIPEKRVKQIS
jgi:hypothetical protein